MRKGEVFAIAQGHLADDRGVYECEQHWVARKLPVVDGPFWPGLGIRDRQLSARPPRTAGFRRDGWDREDRQPTQTCQSRQPKADVWRQPPSEVA